MPLLLPSIIANAGRVQQPFVLLQSSLAQSCIPVLRSIISESKTRVILFTFLHHPSFLLDPQKCAHVQVLDLTDRVPGYSSGAECRQTVLRMLRESTNGPVTVVVDSADTLTSDLGSLSTTLLFLSEILSIIHERGSRSRLVLHMLSSCPLRDIVSQTRFSASLTSLTSYPPVLLEHVAAEYMTPPPPLSPPEKFWGVFMPIAQRHHEAEKLVFSEGARGCGEEEFAVEVLIRGANDLGRRRGIERLLEGWSTLSASPCELSELQSFKSLWSRRPAQQRAPDPTQSVPFNLNLTPAQQQSRSKVPLPYLPERQR
ncbi:hypothetical protein NM688_g9093 [Phlebia brevispora]|uniref:Uncharacterized protein n=1 Tax=Phlebia brevispora TaxID=194682 RepID=A0ACC1RNS9_9APHY|nr:hypothetical protein NM688_g9093 [Phlebia brevispora]